MSKNFISISRRTDIPAFYSGWLEEQFLQGYCDVRNPFNPSQVSRISLKPEDVEGIFFWTRNPVPLIRRLSLLDERQYKYIFLYTITGYPRALEPYSPPLAHSIKTFRKLSGKLGPSRVVWRYDPIIVAPAMNAEYHRQRFAEIASQLEGYTHYCKVSFLDIYGKAMKRLKPLEGSSLACLAPPSPGTIAEIMESFKEISASCDITLESCTEDLSKFGIESAGCVSRAAFLDAFGYDPKTPPAKDQRPGCGCMASRDIGFYNSCLFECAYCYATSSFAKARERYQEMRRERLTR